MAAKESKDLRNESNSFDQRQTDRHTHTHTHTHKERLNVMSVLVA